MGIYLRPADRDDALKALAAQRLTVLAGGTDFYPARVGKPLDDDVLDIAALLIPKPRRSARSTFLKLGARKYLVISIVMVAAVIETDGGKVADARIAVGSCSEAAQRLPALEAALVVDIAREVWGSA